MGKIKKILENELVGGTQSTDVYPVTSVKAVYDENNKRLDNIINKIYSSTPTVADSSTESDLDISDENGNVLVRCENDHIQTKNFNSKNDTPVKSSNTPDADFDLADENGNVILRLSGGNIQTKNFNSAEVSSGSGGSLTQSDFKAYHAIGDTRYYFPIDIYYK